MQAIHDTKYSPSVISISWGGAESTWSKQGIQALNGAIQDASALGVTVCVASGDGGSSDGVTDGLAHVDFPASSPYALGCGGTTLQSSGATVITSEVVWNDQPKDGATGGGVSDVFPLPSWQADAGVPPSANPGARIGRGVPDVCGDADPATGYSTRVDGKDSVVGGTSAVAPLWAGLITLINQKVGKPVGFINSVLYDDDISASSGAFHDITSGNNGAYSAKQGWDACTGLGSPDGARLEARLLSSA
jgi:kumamolisin